MRIFGGKRCIKLRDIALALPEFKLERIVAGENVTWSIFACCDMSRFLHLSSWYQSHLVQSPKTEIALKTAESAATMPEDFAPTLVAAADAERFWNVLRGKKIS